MEQRSQNCCVLWEQKIRQNIPITNALRLPHRNLRLMSWVRYIGHVEKIWKCEKVISIRPCIQCSSAVAKNKNWNRNSSKTSKQQRKCVYLWILFYTHCSMTAINVDVLCRYLCCQNVFPRHVLCSNCAQETLLSSRKSNPDHAVTWCFRESRSRRDRMWECAGAVARARSARPANQHYAARLLVGGRRQRRLLPAVVR